MASFIFLAGPKHSGKTSVGRELANLLVIPFYDLDQLIEEHAGKNIRELYQTSENLFQQEETAALEIALQKKAVNEKNRGVVLALSGSIIDNPGAMAVLKKVLQESEGHCVVCLEVSAGTAWQRIVSQGELPPFLKAETAEASREKHRLLHERRAKGYKKIASFSILAEEKGAATLAAEMAALLAEKLKQ